MLSRPFWSWFSFSEILTASYNHCSLMTNVEFEIVDDGLLPDVVIGSNWIAA
jgi:hypothetical protein